LQPKNLYALWGVSPEQPGHKSLPNGSRSSGGGGGSGND